MAMIVRDSKILETAAPLLLNVLNSKEKKAWTVRTIFLFSSILLRDGGNFPQDLEKEICRQILHNVDITEKVWISKTILKTSQTLLNDFVNFLRDFIHKKQNFDSAALDILRECLDTENFRSMLTPCMSTLRDMRKDIPINAEGSLRALGTSLSIFLQE
eukprot:TRINITY_DN8561_c0_g1_i2.p1 TRINITY_DN8561_c0_g1~~TRINITY_DN8561_c0_g1_i2.p1  ORF type:complete len:159 (+),score=48.36 TRINITY_DN8561_c0_g1_i2:396-872(+)